MSTFWTFCIKRTGIPIPICRQIGIQSSFSSTARMASQREFIAILPDRPNVHNDRLRVRPQHMEGIKKNIDHLDFAGAIIDPDTPANAEAKDFDFKGSIISGPAESKEAFIEALKQDPYTANNVWDWDAVKVYQMKVAVRKAL